MSMFDGYKNRDNKKTKEEQIKFKENISSRFHKKQLEACNNFHKYLCEEYENILTLKTHFSKARKILSEHFKDKKYAKLLNNYNKIFVLADEQSQKIKQDYNQKVILKSRLQVVITEKEFDANITKSLNILEQNNPHHLDLIIALAIVTGRRFFEIGCKAKFSINEANEKALLFEGQAKTRKENKNLSFVIPCFITNFIIINGLKYLRALKPELVNYNSEEFNNRFSRPINTKINKLNLNGIKQPKDVRNLYLAYCLKHYKPFNMANNTYAALILGHSNDDIQTANSYMTHVVMNN